MMEELTQKKLKEGIKEGRYSTSDNGGETEDIYILIGDDFSLPHLWNASKTCDHLIEAKMSGGIACTKCSGWCCL